MSNIEVLESRIAPASLVGKVLTYTDGDGDKVSITFSKGPLNAAMFAFDTGSVDGDPTTRQQLRVIDIHGLAALSGANITVKAFKAGGGDGLASIGYINSTGVDLGDVTIPGDLAQVDAGSGSATLPAIKSLTVRTMGRYGLVTQGGVGDLQSDINGNLGALKVAGDFKDASINNFAKIGSVTIGGSVIGGSGSQTGVIAASKGMGPVRIGHDLVGGGGQFSGLITTVNGAIKSLVVGGSVIGGSNSSSGSVRGGDRIGPVIIRGSLAGGSGGDSGSIQITNPGGDIASITIGESLVGGTGSNSGFIKSIARFFMGDEIDGGNVGPVRIGGNVVGGDGVSAGSITIGGTLASIALGGSLLGGSGTSAGGIFASESTGAVRIGGEIHGGAGVNSGVLSIHSPTSIEVGGSVIGGSNSGAGGISTSDSDGNIRIERDLIGGGGSYSGLVSVNGISNIVIRGSLLGGTGPDSGGIRSQAAIGAIVIDGDIRGGGLAAGAASLNASGMIISNTSIHSITVRGSIMAGTDNSNTGSLTDSAAIHALRGIGAIVIGGSIVGSVGRGGDVTPVSITTTNDPGPSPTVDIVLGKLIVGGRVERAAILAGYDATGSPNDANAQIAVVTVCGDWIASNLIAGIQDAGAAGFGDAGDQIIGGGASISKIARIVIRGTVFGTSAIGDQFGIESHSFGIIKIGGATIPAPTPGSAVGLTALSADTAVRSV